MERVCKRPRPCRLNMTITKMPIDLPGTASLLPQVESILITRDETLFLATPSAIFHVANGRSALLCGHAYDMGYKDGIAFEARFCSIACMAETRTNQARGSQSKIKFSPMTNTPKQYIKHLLAELMRVRSVGYSSCHSTSGLEECTAGDGESFLQALPLNKSWYEPRA